MGHHIGIGRPRDRTYTQSLQISERKTISEGKKYQMFDDNHLLKRLPSSSAQQLIPETLAAKSPDRSQLREPSVLIQFEEEKLLCR